MNKYKEAIKVVDTVLHHMCGEEREDGYLPTMEEMSNSMDLLKDLANKADSRHEEKTAEQMFNDLGYTKRVFDDFIMYEKGDYTRLKIIEFHLRTEIVHPYIEYAVGNAIKNLDVDELKAINKQCEELNWL